MSSNKRVVVAMSGGVDSSVTAYLLKEQGYQVIGITMKIWPEDTNYINNESSCCSLAATYDARRVAEQLDIPYYVLNFKKDFREKVIDYFIQEYTRGRTPNPCIACNKYIKFDALLKKAKQLGASFLATGHYAKIEFDEDRKRFIIRKAEDFKKDQSYTLYNLTQQQLKHILMPLGNYTKDEVRSIAKKIGLKVSDKPDSQEICFIPDNDYKEYLKKHVPGKIKPGPVLDNRGNVVGQHNGISFYTIGQRRGLGISMGKPVYVKKIDPEKNAIVVGFENEVYEKGLLAGDINLVAVEKINGKMLVNSKIRYNAKEVASYIEQISEDQIKVTFQKPQKGVAPGQSVVFYDEDVVVGGGIIKTPL